MYGMYTVCRPCAELAVYAGEAALLSISQSSSSSMAVRVCIPIQAAAAAASAATHMALSLISL